MAAAALRVLTDSNLASPENCEVIVAAGGVAPLVALVRAGSGGGGGGGDGGGGGSGGAEIEAAEVLRNLARSSGDIRGAIEEAGGPDIWQLLDNSRAYGATGASGSSSSASGAFGAAARSELEPEAEVGSARGSHSELYVAPGDTTVRSVSCGQHRGDHGNHGDAQLAVAGVPAVAKAAEQATVGGQAVEKAPAAEGVATQEAEAEEAVADPQGMEEAAADICRSRQASIATAEAAATLVALLRHGSEGAKEAAVAALAELVRRSRGPAKICDAGGVPLLVRLVQGDLPVGAPAKAFAAETLNALALNAETRRVVLRRLGISGMDAARLKIMAETPGLGS